MKTFVICCAVLAALGVVNCQGEFSPSSLSSLREYASHQRLEKAKEKIESICPGYGDRFEEALKKVGECESEREREDETLCASMKDLTCIKPAIKLMEECLPQRSREIPSLILQSIQDVTQYACATNGEHIFELTNPCLFNMNYRTQRCINRVHVKLQQYQTKTPSKDELCEFMGSLRGCLQSHVTEACGSPITRESFMGVFDAAAKTCTSYKTAVVTDEMTDLNKVEVY